MANNVINLVSKAFASFKKGGLRGLALSICNYLANHLNQGEIPTNEDNPNDIGIKIDTSNRYAFIDDKPFGKSIQPSDVDKYSINWLVPSFENSSGGHLTIFRLIKDLETLGFKSRIVFEKPIKGKTVEEIRDLIAINFLPLDCPISFGADSVSAAYFTVATNWTTAYLLKNFNTTLEKIYLIQDYEPYFYGVGSDYYLAERTYDFGFKTFVGGEWLVEQLKTKHNVNATAFPFGCDHNLYGPTPKFIENSTDKKLLFYARPSTPRRGFELAMLAFEKLLARVDNVQIVLAGCDFSAYELPPHMKSVGIVPMRDLPSLYRSCDAALIISFTNVSLLPLDLMASGCAVISNSGPQVEWLLNEQIASLAKADPDSLSLAIENLLTNNHLRQEKIERAQHFVSNLQWKEAAKVIGHNLKQIAQLGSSEQQPSLIH
jgi:glycosyltransferase involved in cell wall biosynthesis